MGTTIWQDDYLDAFRRHGEDAERLYKAERWANADHLYGMSAECGVKAVMKALGMTVNRAGRPIDEKYTVHINDLWDAFLTFAQGKGAARYVALLPPSNPFANWRVGQRYANQHNFAESFVQAHRRGLEYVCSLVRAALEDGLLV
jgi:hypothetical protein